MLYALPGGNFDYSVLGYSIIKKLFEQANCREARIQSLHPKGLTLLNTAPTALHSRIPIAHDISTV